MNQQVQNALVASVSLLFIVSAVDVALRYWPASGPAVPEGGVSGGYMQLDSRAQWVPRPGETHHAEDAEGNPVLIRINSTGQRGEEVPERQAGETRILVLGDSFTMATETPEDSTFVARVGNDLRQQLDGQVSVINAGVDGYGTYNELAYYRYYGRRLRPDTVLLCFYLGNDFRDNMVCTLQGREVNSVLVPSAGKYTGRHASPHLQAEKGKRLLDPVSGALVPRTDSQALDWLQTRSPLLRLLCNRTARLWSRISSRVDALDVGHRYHFYEVGLFQMRDNGYFRTARELTLDCIHWLNRIVLEDGGQFAVALLPSINQVDAEHFRDTLADLGVRANSIQPLDRRYPSQLVTTYCRSQGIPCLDLTGVFAAEPAPTELYLAGKGNLHLNCRGHGLVARELTRFLGAQAPSARSAALRKSMDGRQMLEEGRYEQAVGALQEGVALHEPSASSHVALGNAYLAMGRAAEARRAFGRATEADDNMAAAWEGLGRALTEMGEADRAVRAVANALRARPAWWPYYEDLLRLHRETGDQGAAAQMEEAMRVVFERTLDSTRRCWWEEHRSQGEFLMATGQLVAAAVEFRRAARWYPDDPLAYYSLGLLHQRQDQPDSARAWFLRTLAVAPRHAEALNNMGTAFEKLGRPDSAAACYRRALSLRPEARHPSENLARLSSGLAERAPAMCETGQILPLEGLCRELLLVRGEDRFAAYYLAVSLFLQGRYAESIQVNTTLVQQHPGFAEGYLQLGNAYETVGEIEAARRVYEEQLRRNPQGDLAKDARQRLGRLPKEMSR